MGFPFLFSAQGLHFARRNKRSPKLRCASCCLSKGLRKAKCRGKPKFPSLMVNASACLGAINQNLWNEVLKQPCPGLSHFLRGWDAKTAPELSLFPTEMVQTPQKWLRERAQQKRPAFALAGRSMVGIASAAASGLVSTDLQHLPTWSVESPEVAGVPTLGCFLQTPAERFKALAV